MSRKDVVIELSAQEFYTLLNSKKHFSIDDEKYIVNEVVFFPVKNYDYNIQNQNSVYLRNFTFRSNVYIENIQSNFHFAFDHCTFYKDILINVCKFSNFQIVNSVVYSLTVKESSINFFSFAMGSVETLALHSSSKAFMEICYFLHAQVTFLQMRKYSYGYCSFLYCGIRSITFDPNYKFNDNDKDSLPKKEKALSKTHIKSLSFLLTDKTEDLSLSNLDIDCFTLAGRCNGKVLYFKNINTDDFNIKEFVNDGTLRFHNFYLNNEGKGQISDSQLGKTEFNNVKLGRAKMFRIYNSNLSEIAASNTVFPSNIRGETDDDYLETREVYRQLKFASSKQGDRIKELEYEKYEMINYQKSLKLDLSINGIWRALDRFILLTNRLSNDHGQNWLFSLLWFIVITPILYAAIKYNLGNEIIFGVFPTKENCAEYLEVSLNPLHDFNKIFSNGKSSNFYSAKIFDSILKLVSGYLIFQFLRAFRKFVR
jgi:hypothetical protein